MVDSSLPLVSSFFCSLAMRLGSDPVIAQASIFGGFVLGRTVGIAIGGAPNLFIMALLVGEIAGLLVALVLLRQLSRSTRAQ